MAKDLEPYIADAIESFLVQKCPFAFEIILSDDASTDSTLSICEEYRERFPHIVRVLSAEHRVGVEKNFIRTIKACSGEFIAFCDGDDYWTDDRKLARQVAFLQAHPDCSLVCSDYDYINVRGEFEVSSYKVGHYGKRFTIYDDLDESIATTLTVVARRSALARLIDPLTPESHPFIWDTVLWAYCLTSGWGYFLPGKTAIRRVLASGEFTARDRVTQLDINRRSLLSLHQIIANEKIRRFLSMKLYANTINSARAVSQKGDRNAARQMLLSRVFDEAHRGDVLSRAKYLYAYGRSVLGLPF